jgi:predicted nucleic acid-binding protein
VITSPLPSSVYLDTSIVVAAMFAETPHAAASAEFCAAVARQGGRAFFSQILWLELSQVLAKLPHGPHVPVAQRSAHRLDAWDTNRVVREQWLAFGLREFATFTAQFHAIVEVAFDRSIWHASIDVIAQTRLRAHDAIHVATARAAGVRDFATLDDHFRRVPDLRLWLIRDTRSGRVPPGA